ncbi:hypothetical protein GCM10022217_01340 [Chryseobacterium ginsenosidimutans]|uniref:restriction endonuclease n=1 Tax=Chryseobacterium ginsenosidimutans TaxID=687846 RepID=UPI0031DABD60
MEIERFFNILEGFNFANLKDSEFKEDSVREEIILPIIKGLGYTVDPPNKIIRSRKLLHPFVSIGSQKKSIYIIPDYLLELNGKPAWILDAKSPGEDIMKSKNVEQAYSYAIHSEVRVNFYALCNGKEFILFDVQKTDPVLHFPIEAIPLYWESLKKILAPENVFAENHYILAKDLGLHLKRLGFAKNDQLIFSSFPLNDITQLGFEMYTISGSTEIDKNRYVVSFDFPLEILNQLSGKIPQELIDDLKIEDGQRQKAYRFGDISFLIDIECVLSEELQENENEIFLPLFITKVL